MTRRDSSGTIIPFVNGTYIEDVLCGQGDIDYFTITATTTREVTLVVVPFDGTSVFSLSGTLTLPQTLVFILQAGDSYMFNITSLNGNGGRYG